MTCYTRARVNRWLSVAGLASLTCLSSAAWASATSVRITRADGVTPIARYQRLVDRSPAPTRPGVLRVVYGNVDDGVPVTEYTDDRVIHVGRGRPMLDETFFHELGHDWQQTLTDRAFDTWRLWVGVRQTRWQTSPYDAPEEGYHSTRWMAQEYMADWYAGCATRGYSSMQVSWHSSLLRGSYDGWSVMPGVWSASCRRIYRLPTRGDS